MTLPDSDNVAGTLRDTDVEPDIESVMLLLAVKLRVIEPLTLVDFDKLLVNDGDGGTLRDTDAVCEAEREIDSDAPELRETETDEVTEAVKLSLDAVDFDTEWLPVEDFDTLAVTEVEPGMLRVRLADNVREAETEEDFAGEIDTEGDLA